MAITITYVTRKDIYKKEHKLLPLKDLELHHFLLNANIIANSNKIHLLSIKEDYVIKELK